MRTDLFIISGCSGINSTILVLYTILYYCTLQHYYSTIYYTILRRLLNSFPTTWLMFCVTFVTTATGKNNYFGEIEYVLLVLPSYTSWKCQGQSDLHRPYTVVCFFITKRKCPNLLLLYFSLKFIMCFISFKLGCICHVGQFWSL